MTGLNQSKSGSVHLQAVNLEGRTGSLGALTLQEGAHGTNLFVAELPQELLTHNNFSVVLHAVDSEGQKVERTASQVATTVGSLLEVSWPNEEGNGSTVLILSALYPLPPPPPPILLRDSNLKNSGIIPGSVINALVCSS